MRWHPYTTNFTPMPPHGKFCVFALVVKYPLLTKHTNICPHAEPNKWPHARMPNWMAHHPHARMLNHMDTYHAHIIFYIAYRMCKRANTTAWLYACTPTRTITIRLHTQTHGHMPKFIIVTCMFCTNTWPKSYILLERTHGQTTSAWSLALNHPISSSLSRVFKHSQLASYNHNSTTTYNISLAVN